MKNLQLISQEETAVNVASQEEYDHLLMLYELNNWVCYNSLSPTSFDNWQKYKKETCIGAGTDMLGNAKGYFGFSNISFYKEHNWNIISFNEFLKIQEFFSCLHPEFEPEFSYVLPVCPTHHH